MLETAGGRSIDADEIEMEDDGDLARDRDFRFPHADPLDQLYAPHLQGRPLPGSMWENVRSIVLFASIVASENSDDALISCISPAAGVV